MAEMPIRIKGNSKNTPTMKNQTRLVITPPGEKCFSYTSSEAGLHVRRIVSLSDGIEQGKIPQAPAVLLAVVTPTTRAREGAAIAVFAGLFRNRSSLHTASVFTPRCVTVAMINVPPPALSRGS